MHNTFEYYVDIYVCVYIWYGNILKIVDNKILNCRLIEAMHAKTDNNQRNTKKSKNEKSFNGNVDTWKWRNDVKFAYHA